MGTERHHVVCYGGLGGMVDTGGDMGIWDVGIWAMGYGIWDVGIWDMGCGDVEYGI